MKKSFWVLVVRRVNEKQWVSGKWMVLEKSILQFYLLFFQNEHQLFGPAESFDGAKSLMEFFIIGKSFKRHELKKLLLLDFSWDLYYGRDAF